MSVEVLTQELNLYHLVGENKTTHFKTSYDGSNLELSNKRISDDVDFPLKFTSPVWYKDTEGDYQDLKDKFSSVDSFISNFTDDVNLRCIFILSIYFKNYTETAYYCCKRYCFHILKI